MTERFLRSILCKGLSYPPVHPKPVMSMLSLKLPLCELNTEKAEIEVGWKGGERGEGEKGGERGEGEKGGERGEGEKGGERGEGEKEGKRGKVGGREEEGGRE